MLAIFSISPVGEGESLSEPVSEAVKIIADSGLDYELTSMGTIIEGDVEDVFAVIQDCHKKLRAAHHRVTSSIIIDDRGEETGRITAKVEAVEKRLKAPETVTT